VHYMEESAAFLLEEFAVRLESAVEQLLALQPKSRVRDERHQIAEALHRGVLLDLRERLGKVLSGKRRVAVLIDNLDKAWQRSADIEQMAFFLLGLLSTTGRISEEFARKDHWREPVFVTLAVFLRSDIYSHVARVAREPDKIPVSRLVWTDGELLLRVVEERYLSHQGAGSNPKHLWSRFFCATTRGMSTPEYVLFRVLPRPRDIIYFCGAAIAAAVNRQSPLVEEKDILKGEALYSQFALEALQVENGISMAQLEGVLYEFAGSPAVIPHNEMEEYIIRAGVPREKVGEVIEQLRSLSFLGIEIGQDRFDFAYEFRQPAVAEALSRRRAVLSAGGVRYQIHPAFRSYLEVQEN